MELRWHSYRYYPYERELALREVRALLSVEDIAHTRHGIRLAGSFAVQALERLVYFAAAINGEHTTATIQARLERGYGNRGNRQATRYSAHGLHEYKGKFNPQIARAILNILRVPSGARVLDPFCGSGTALVECAHLGMQAIGTDINPLAVFLANAKLSALQLSVARLRKESKAVLRHHTFVRTVGKNADDARIHYLQQWFTPPILDEIERLRLAIQDGAPECAPVLFAIASNLLRDYSLQDPHDLRIRRRHSALPETPFIEAFTEATALFLRRLEAAQHTLAQRPTVGKALLLDSRFLNPGSNGLGTVQFDCALTSPPYATALPYIDTQRLSLVWLELLAPADMLPLEARLIGSREVRGERKQELLAALLENRRGLPTEQADFCLTLQAAVADQQDGFRRQAVPLLLYRYFVGMAEVLRAVRRCIKDGAPFALIVGRNHTILGGKRFEINTPHHLAALAGCCGWTHEETVPLQTYQRYGYHMSNAVHSEALVIVRAR